MTPPFSTMAVDAVTNEVSTLFDDGFPPATTLGVPEPPQPELELRLTDSRAGARMREIPLIYRCVEAGRVVEREVPGPPNLRRELPRVIVRGNLDSPHRLAAGILDALGRAGWVPLPPRSPDRD